MNILVDARPLVDPLAGGVTRVAAGLLPALITAMPEHRFTFVTTGTRKPQIPLPNHRHFTIPNKLWSALCFLKLNSLDHVFQKEKFDFLFLSNLGFVGQPRIPYALVVHDISFLIEPKWFSWKARFWHKAVHARRLIRQATLLFAVSECTKKDLMKYLNIPGERIRVIPLGLTRIKSDRDGYADGNECADRNENGQTCGDGQAQGLPLPAILENKRFVLCLGANDRRKNARCAIEAVKTLHREPKFQDVILVLTGVGAPLAGALSDTDAHADTVSHSNTTAATDGTDTSRNTILSGWAGTRPAPTIFLKHPPDTALSTLMKHASAFLYPSWYEGFGLPLHEAAAFGTPCIASTAGALPETAPTGTLFAPPSKPHLWTEALIRLLAQPTGYQTTQDIRDWSHAAQVIKTAIHSTVPSA